MTDQTEITSGEPNKSPVDNEGKKDVVAYESFQKVLNEKKAMQAKAQEVESKLEEVMMAQKAQEEAKLNESGEFKKLAELKDQKINELQSVIDEIQNERDAVKNDLQDTWKLQAFYQKLGGSVKRNEYLSFVDLDSIVIDPETRQVDETSVENVVSKFMEHHGDLVNVKRSTGLPSDAPRSVAPRAFNELSEVEKSEMMRNTIASTLVKKKR